MKQIEEKNDIKMVPKSEVFCIKTIKKVICFTRARKTLNFLTLQRPMETSSLKGDGAVDGDNETALSDGASQRNILYLMIILVLTAMVITLGILNLYQAGYLDGISSDSEASTQSLCNGHGKKYDEINVCECIQCWSGVNCEIEDDNCYITAGSGQPHLFLEACK